jgi:phage terminase large subunit-like protein
MTKTRETKSSARSAAKRAARRASRDGIVAKPARRPTLGPLVCKWIEANLVHGEGDYYGQPIKLRTWQRAFIYECYELLPDGTRAYDRVLLGIPKGNGKTEIAAMIACAELGGPVVFAGWNEDGSARGKRRLSPEIPIAAASFEQADKLFGAAKIMIGKGRLAAFFEVYDTEILEKNGPGKMFRVAAAAGTNDGGKPSFFGADEVHEWTGNKERVHLVLSNGRAKRAGSWELNISTAGASVRSLLGRMIKLAKDIKEGRAKDDRLLVVWFGLPSDEELKSLSARKKDLPKTSPLRNLVDMIEEQESEGFDPLDDEQLRAAIRVANPAAGDFLDVEKVAARFREIPEHEGRRYYLNQWSDAPERWIQTADWDRCKSDRGEPDDEAEIVLALEGNSTRESVALVGATIEAVPHIFVVQTWQKSAQVKKAPVDEVEDAIRQACERWDVRLIGANPNRWPQTIETLQEEFGDDRMIEYDSHKPALMVVSCTQFYDAVTAEGEPGLTHDGNEILSAHLGNAIVKEDGRGRRITKDNSDTPKSAAEGIAPRFIEAAVAGVVAYDLVQRAGAEDNDDDWRPV